MSALREELLTAALALEVRLEPGGKDWIAGRLRALAARCEPEKPGEAVAMPAVLEQARRALEAAGTALHESNWRELARSLVAQGSSGDTFVHWSVHGGPTVYLRDLLSLDAALSAIEAWQADEASGLDPAWESFRTAAAEAADRAKVMAEVAAELRGWLHHSPAAVTVMAEEIVDLAARLASAAPEKREALPEAVAEVARNLRIHATVRPMGEYVVVPRELRNMVAVLPEVLARDAARLESLASADEAETGGRCESCGNPAAGHSLDEVPLCGDCGRGLEESTAVPAAPDDPTGNLRLAIYEGAHRLSGRLQGIGAGSEPFTPEQIEDAYLDLIRICRLDAPAPDEGECARALRELLDTVPTFLGWHVGDDGRVDSAWIVPCREIPSGGGYIAAAQAVEAARSALSGDSQS